MIIALTCFNRLHTLQKTIESLEKCNLFQFTPVHYFQDYRGSDIYFRYVYDYLLTKKRTIDVIHRTFQHRGLKNNTLWAIKTSFKEDDKIIWLQDDMEFSKDFLEFMNFALNEYKNDQEIMYVSGYSPVVHHSLYLSPYFSEAVGMWKDKFCFTDNFSNDDAKDYRNFAGDMFFNMLMSSSRKDIISVFLNYSMYVKNSYCLHPNRNKLRHLVTDSINCKAKDAKKLNQVLLEGFSRRIDSGNLDLVKRYSPLKKLTRWISRGILS